MPLVNRTFDQLIDFTRTSAATFVNSSGNIASTAQSRNLLTFTQEFDNAAWIKQNATVAANSTAAPDGTSTADTVTISAQFGNVRQALSPTISTGSVTISVWLRVASGTRNVHIRATDISTVYQSEVTVTTTWTRFTATFAYDGVNPFDFFTIQDRAASGFVPIFVWGAQMETGTTVTDYTRNFGGLFPPRFDYDPVTRAPRGLLIEEQRTNLFTYSQDFSNAAWDADGTTKTSGLAGGRDGTASVGEFSKVNAGSHYPRNTSTNMAANTTYTISMWLWHTGTPPTDVKFAYYDGSWNLSPNLAITTTPTRFTWTVTTGATAPSFGTGLYLNFGASGGAVRVWGAQVEAGAFATSYIPTVASQVTRTADTANIRAPNLASWFNASEGTLLVEADSVVGNVVQAYRPAAFSDGGANNALGAYIFSANRGAWATVGGVSQADVGAAGHTANAIGKWAFAFKVNDFALSINGSAALTDTSGTVPTVDRLSIGSLDSINQLNGHVRSLRFYPTRLTNAQLQALTA